MTSKVRRVKKRCAVSIIIILLFGSRTRFVYAQKPISFECFVYRSPLIVTATVVLIEGGRQLSREYQQDEENPLARKKIVVRYEDDIIHLEVDRILKDTSGKRPKRRGRIKLYVPSSKNIPPPPNQHHYPVGTRGIWILTRTDEGMYTANHQLSYRHSSEAERISSLIESQQLHEEIPAGCLP